ncbi:Glutathione S-transferase Mu 5, partial [Armadillidium vulgare]
VQYIKFLLEYTGEEYVDKLYEFGPAPDYDRSQWRKEKFELGLEIPNLPYYIDGDVKLTQSVAILRHIARKHNLLAKTDVNIAKADMLEYEAMDLRMSFGRICGPDFESQKGSYIKETAEPKLVQLSSVLGSNDWFLGSSTKPRSQLVGMWIDCCLIFIDCCQILIKLFYRATIILWVQIFVRLVFLCIRVFR